MWCFDIGKCTWAADRQDRRLWYLGCIQRCWGRQICLSPIFERLWSSGKVSNGWKTQSRLKGEKGSKELQADWPNLERWWVFLLVAVTRHMKNRQATGNRQHGLSKDKSSLTTLPAFCAGSVNKGRAMLISKDVKQYWPQCWPLREATDNQLPVGIHTPDHDPLRAAIQPAFHPPYSPLIHSSSLAPRMWWEVTVKAKIKSRLSWHRLQQRKSWSDKRKTQPHSGLVAWWDSGTPCPWRCPQHSDPRPWATWSARALFQWRDGSDGWEAPRQVPSKLVVLWSILWCVC